MKRVVVTGIGIVSSLGHCKETVASALRNGKSGIVFREDFKQMGLKCHVGGALDIDPSHHIDRKLLRFMAPCASYAYLSTQQAVVDSKLPSELVSHPRTGLVMGSGGVSGIKFTEAAEVMRTKGIKYAGPYRVTQTMNSCVSATVASPLNIKGVNYSLTSACATSAHCIGHGVELIQLGKQDVIFAGGADDIHWTTMGFFDAMGALTHRYNDTPSLASRPYDRDRDGFVPSLGSGTIVLEEYQHALKRGAHILCEITGYGATCDGADMVVPSGEGAERCMHMALNTTSRPVDYINTHGTGTPRGDLIELEAIGRVFRHDCPDMSATKSLSGHSLGAAGVHEAIFSILMMQNDFIAGSAHIDHLDTGANGYPIIQQTKYKKLDSIMSNSFGFGGTNACLIFERLNA
ncbi:MAG: beta-ketoacyl synthase N-terminal-like domain-containing protein [Pseudomonadota bacterium]|nr:beta-ketoacyl synthase N-terminal-like domain-containing protein [Pseudomonadota bacterium]